MQDVGSVVLNKLNPLINKANAIAWPYLKELANFYSFGLIAVFLFITAYFTATHLLCWSFGNLGTVGLSDSFIKEYMKKNEIEKRKHSQIYTADNPTRKVITYRWLFHKVHMLFFILNILVVLFFVFGTVWIYLISKPSYFNGYLIGDNILLGAVCGLIFSFILAKLIYVYYVRVVLAEYGTAVNQSILNNRKRVNTDKGVISDVRDVQFNNRLRFNPVAYFDKAKKLNSVFLGIDDKQEPIYIARDKWKKTNIQIMGEAGSGKGVLACCALAQCAVNYNDCNIIFDPKNDEWAVHVMKEQSKRFILVDLRQGQNAQLNLFKDLNSYQLEELLISGFELGRKGRDSDHFRIGEREAIKMLARMFPNGTNARDLMLQSNELPKDVKSESRDILIQLRELCSLSVLQTDQGIDLKDFILNGGTLYFRGHMRDESIIILQKIIFLRCIQLIEERDRTRETVHVNIFLDEFKYLLSKNTLNSLGTVRDKNCNILISHQSLGDFGDCGDLSEKSVSSTIIDNTPIKWIYRMSDLKASEWASGYTGDILVDSERRNISTADGNVEHESTNVTKFKEKRKLIDTNTIQHLPEGCALFIGNGIARLSYSNYINATKGNIELQKFAEFEPLNFNPITSVEPKETTRPIKSNHSDLDYSANKTVYSNELKDFNRGSRDEWEQ